MIEKLRVYKQEKDVLTVEKDDASGNSRPFGKSRAEVIYLRAIWDLRAYLKRLSQMVLERFELSFNGRSKLKLWTQL